MFCNCTPPDKIKQWVECAGSGPADWRDNVKDMSSTEQNWGRQETMTAHSESYYCLRNWFCFLFCKRFFFSPSSLKPNKVTPHHLHWVLNLPRTRDDLKQTSFVFHTGCRLIHALSWFLLHNPFLSINRQELFQESVLVSG